MGKKIKRVEMGVHVQLGKLHYYELKYYWDNEEGQERFNILEVPAKSFKDRGIIKRTNSYKKVTDWINGTDEGKEFFINGLKLKHGGAIDISFISAA
jgi:hypothetical protein